MGGWRGVAALTLPTRRGVPRSLTVSASCLCASLAVARLSLDSERGRSRRNSKPKRSSKPYVQLCTMIAIKGIATLESSTYKPCDLAAGGALAPKMVEPTRTCVAPATNAAS